MLIVGIAGGIASGKSAVSACFEAQGAQVLDADRAGHKVLCLDTVCDQIRNIWGNSVFQKDGQVDRQALGKIVFDPESGHDELIKLETITHPLIKQTLENQIRELDNSGEFPVAILDAPVMFKAGWDSFCDFIVFVESSYDNRLARAIQRGWSQSEFDRRESLQASIEYKQSKANWVVRNNGSRIEIQEQVSLIWRELLKKIDK